MCPDNQTHSITAWQLHSIQQISMNKKQRSSPSNKQTTTPKTFRTKLFSLTVKIKQNCMDFRAELGHKSQNCATVSHSHTPDDIHHIQKQHVCWSCSCWKWTEKLQVLRYNRVSASVMFSTINMKRKWRCFPPGMVEVFLFKSRRNRWKIYF